MALLCKAPKGREGDTLRNSQDLWIGVSRDLLITPSDPSGRSMSLPFLNTAPARTSVTRWGALTARHRVCADSMSLNAFAAPAAREPGPW